jgi:hypothetical protein
MRSFVPSAATLQSAGYRVVQTGTAGDAPLLLAQLRPSRLPASACLKSTVPDLADMAMKRRPIDATGPRDLRSLPSHDGESG